jgi:antitoxin PrlF
MHVTTKGQVTIPRKIRDKLGIKAGAHVDFVENESGEVVLKVLKNKNIIKSRFAHVRGTADKGLSTDQIMEITRGE